MSASCIPPAPQQSPSGSGQHLLDPHLHLEARNCWWLWHFLFVDMAGDIFISQSKYLFHWVETIDRFFFWRLLCVQVYIWYHETPIYSLNRCYILLFKSFLPFTVLDLQKSCKPKSSHILHIQFLLLLILVLFICCNWWTKINMLLLTKSQISLVSPNFLFLCQDPTQETLHLV